MYDVPITVKDALKEGSYRKNYRFNVLNDDETIDFTIDNDTLVKESVKIDEKMCSGKKLKFGLCEGSTIEFQYFNHPNITGRRFQAFIDVYYGEEEPYTIPMGFFTIDESSRQASTGIIKATGYNKLRSKYLDEKANKLIDNAYDVLSSDTYISGVTIDLILREVLGDFAIDNTEKIPYTLSSYIVPTGAAYRDPYYRYAPIVPGEYHIPTIIVSHIMDIEVTDTNILDSSRTIKGYTSVKIKGINAIKEYMINRMGSEYFGEGSFYIELQNANGTFTQSLDNVGDEFTTQILDYVNDVDIRGGSQQTLVGRSHIRLCVPANYRWSETEYYPTAAQEQEAESIISTLINDLLESGDLTIEIIHQVTGGAGEETVDSSVENWNDVTLRELQSAVFETQCQFGRLDRETDLFSGVELNKSRLYPQDTLYPSNSLYPSNTSLSGFKATYSKLWSDEGNVRKWKYLIITYKTLDSDGNEVDTTLQRTIHADGTDNYNCSDNWLFRNLTWTAEQIGEYADAMAAKMRNMVWFPFEMWCGGLPYIETGDEIEIILGTSTHTSYVLQRTLKGIQDLQDTYFNGNLDIF